MPQAESEHTLSPSRRDVLRSTDAMPVPAAGDAEIVALGAELARLVAYFDDNHDDDAIERVFPAIESLERRISDRPATTAAGLAVKLRIAADMLLGGPPAHGHTTDQLNLLSALADVERMAGRA